MRAGTRIGLGLLGLLALLAPGASLEAKTPFAEGGVVRVKCSVCHRPDAQGRLEAIEETRKTPEEWRNVVDRMIRLNGAPIKDSEVHPVVKELSQHLILAPVEMAAVAYYNSDENSQFRERSSLMKTDTDKRIFQACVRCHAYGKILAHRKTEDQWKENTNLHIGYYPTTVFQMREMDWPKEAMDLAKVLAGMFPVDSPQWKSWMESRSPQDLAGKWKIAGYQPGLGYYEGAYTFKANSKKGEDEYLIEREVVYQNGTTLKQSGEGTLFGEYHLRYALAASQLVGRVEGVFDLDAAAQGFGGKWWTVVQDTNAYGNEEFYKADGAARIFAVFPQALKANGAARSLTLVGVNLPAALAAADVAFADPNVKAKSVKRVDANRITVEVTAAGGAALGPCAVQVKGAACDESLVVYDKLDGIKVFPALGRARIDGGAAYPPQGVQFVARGVSYGRDGKADTDDDMILEPVAARWWLEEEKTREDDDDMKYLQTSIANGLYVPVTTFAPIETRRQSVEGVGLIAVGASYEEGAQELKARALLTVTEPDYVTHIK
ncbi:MAG: quinohemoprotein amine dehydrogenase subunit alpha [bacterium]